MHKNYVSIIYELAWYMIIFGNYSRIKMCACIMYDCAWILLLLFTSILHIFYKFLPKSVVFLYPRTWKKGNQLWEWPGLLSKMLQISQSIVFNTDVMGSLTGAMQWALNLIQLLPFCLNFFLVLNTMLEWEQCLLLERESGVKSWQRQPLTVSFLICISNCVIMWHSVTLQLSQCLSKICFIFALTHAPASTFTVASNVVFSVSLSISYWNQYWQTIESLLLNHISSWGCEGWMVVIYLMVCLFIHTR